MKNKISKYWRPVLVTSYCVALTVIFFKMVLTPTNNTDTTVKAVEMKKVEDVEITYPAGERPEVVEEVKELKEVEKTREPGIAVEEVEHCYYDIPMSDHLQDHVFIISNAYKVDPNIIFAMIKRESNFNSGAISSDGSSYGLMQIQPRWHQDRMDGLGCYDLLDPYQNITVGIDYIAELYESGNSTEWVLMAYNGGTAYANKKIRRGEVSSYARTIINNSKSLKVREVARVD